MSDRFLLQDKVRARRARNNAAILADAKARIEAREPDKIGHVHPRVLGAVLEGGAWAEETELQKMWSGMLVASCTPDGRDSNIIFVDLLSKLTSAQCRIVNYSCEGTPKKVNPAGLIAAKVGYLAAVAEVLAISQLADIHQLDIELDRLRDLGLVIGGFDSRRDSLTLTATSLALNLYVRCQGFVGPATDYFKLDIPKPEEAAQTEQKSEPNPLRE